MSITDRTDRPRLGNAAHIPPTTGGTRLPGRVVLGFLLLASLGTGVVLSILGPTVPAIAARLGVPVAALGAVFTASFLSGTLTTVAAGALFDRIGARALIPGGLAAMALGLLGEGAATSLPLVVLASVLAGAGTGVINVAVSAAGARLYPERRATVLTWLNVCFGIGAFLTPLAVGFSLARLGGYTPAYIAGATIVLLPIVPLLVGLPLSIGGNGGAFSHPRNMLALLRNRNLLLLMALAGLYLGAEIGFAGWIVTIVGMMTHLPPAQLAPAASAFWVCLAVGGAPTTYLLQRGVTPRRLIVGGALTAAVGTLLLLVVGGSAPLAVAACALIGLAFAPILPLTTSLAVGHGRRTPDGSDGARIAAIFTTGQVGAATLPALQGALLGIGVGPALGLTAVCSLAMAGLAAVVNPNEHDPSS